MSNKEQIKKMIKEYVGNDFDNYAILIDGEWGSGKTYFIKKELIEEIKKDVIYISLYGITKLEDIDKQINNSIMQDLIEANKTAKTIDELLDTKPGKMIKEFGKTLSIFKALIPGIKDVPKIDININSFISIFKEINEYVLIFDDLERCKIDANEILGYINNFVEHKECKCIIVANQKEMNRKNAYQNIENKMLVALDNRVICEETKKEKEFEFLSSSSTNEKNTEKENFKYTLSEINDRVYKLFNEDQLYNQIKEKLIGKVLYYRPNLLEILEAIIENSNYSEIKDRVNECKTNIVKIFEDRQHLNIRTLKVGLNNLKIIINNINIENFKNNDYYEDLLSKITRYTFEATINHKVGIKSLEWESFTEFCEVYATRELSVRFKFIDDLVYNGFIDGDNVNKVIEEYLKAENAKGENINDPVYILNSQWFLLEDEEIIKYTDKVLNKLSKKTYEIGQYPKILGVFIIIKNMGFNESYLRKCLDNMKKNIEETECIDIELDSFGIHFEEKRDADEFSAVIGELNLHMEKIKCLGNEKTINSTIIKKENWSEDFIDYCDKNKFLKDKQFIKLVDIENLVEVIKESKVKDIRNFGRELNTIYGFLNIKDFFQDDKDNLILIYKKLENMNKDKFSITKKHAIGFLSASIEEILKKLD